MVYKEEYYDPAERRRQKQLDRERDDAMLRDGLITAGELQRRNSMFTGLDLSHAVILNRRASVVTTIPETPMDKSPKELQVITLKTDLEVSGRKLPAGSTGTIVGIYRDGMAYEVEFTDPHLVVTVVAVDVETK